MKTTGIIRRIDDLGRIVIPKELRKSLRIKNGDSLEIFVDQEDIILKKYSPIESIEEAAMKYVEGFNQVIKHNVIVTDKDKVIAVSGELKKKYLGKKITEFTERGIERRDIEMKMDEVLGKGSHREIEKATTGKRSSKE